MIAIVPKIVQRMRSKLTRVAQYLPRREKVTKVIEIAIQDQRDGWRMQKLPVLQIWSKGGTDGLAMQSQGEALSK